MLISYLKTTRSLKTILLEFSQILPIVAIGNVREQKRTICILIFGMKELLPCEAKQHKQLSLLHHWQEPDMKHNTNITQKYWAQIVQTTSEKNWHIYQKIKIRQRQLAVCIICISVQYNGMLHFYSACQHQALWFCRNSDIIRGYLQL